ncbi:MAG: hypothetical protein U5N86_01910 [Planctomycetota bacterium]|nr:hypothetical protein [Planctomycetota bacterium]
MRGLERIVMLAKELNPDEPSDELLRANLFSAYHQYVNPLYKEYSADNDLEFLLKIAEVSTGQKFEGDDLAERRDALLQWWTEHRNEQTVPEND